MCTVVSSQASVPIPKLPSAPAQSLLPIQAIPRTTASRIEDSKGRLIAVGGLVRYSTNQAYFVLQHLDAEFARGKAVTVYAPNEDVPLNLRIDSIHDSFPDRSHMRMYMQVHWNAEERLVLEHLIDNLAETALGRRNLELKKNITIDIFDSDADTFLRDRAGFMVSDRLQFHQITLDAEQMMRYLDHRKSVVPAEERVSIEVEDVSSAEKVEELQSYDAALSSYNRAEFLEYLLSKTKAYLARFPAVSQNGTSKGNDKATDAAIKEASLAGYMVVAADNQRVLGLYAESQTVAEALMRHHLAKSNTKKVIFCTTKTQWKDLSSTVNSFEARTIYRRHTRALPSNIKWEKIFAINVGMNLF